MSVIRFMLLGLVVLGVIALGGVMGNLVAKEPGYVLLTYDGKSVETSLWFAVILLVSAYIVLRLVFALVARLWRSPSLLGRWSSKRRHKGAAARTTQGLLLMAEGAWAEAQRALVAAAPNAQAPLLNYLTAAQAAAKLGDREQRDELLVKAEESTPGSKLAVGLARAEMQQEAGQWDASLTQLQTLREMSPRHPVVQRLYVNGLQHTGQHQALAEELGGLRKSKALTKNEYAQIEQAAASALISQQSDLAELRQLYQGLPKSQKTAPTVALAMARRGLQLDAKAVDADTQLTELAEPVLRSAIDKDPSGPLSHELLETYSQLKGNNASRLSALQKWAKKVPQHAGLHLAIARVQTIQGDTDAAEASIGKAQELQGSDAGTAHWDQAVEMARLHCAQGDAQQALVCLEQARPTGLVLPATPSTAADADSDSEAIEKLTEQATGTG